MNFQERNIEEKKETISFSKVKTFYECPQKFKLKYLDKIDADSFNLNGVFGMSIHLSIQNLLIDHYSNSLKTFFEYARNFSEEFCESLKKNKVEYSENEKKVFIAAGLKIISFCYENFPELDFFSPKKTRLIDTEFKLEQKVTDWLTFNGYIDLLIYNKAKDLFYVIDIKTVYFDFNFSSDKEKLQMHLYKKYLSQQLRIPEKKIKTLYFIFSKLSNKMFWVQDFEYDQSPETYEKMLNDFIDFVYDEKGNLKENYYYKNASPKNCKYCPFADVYCDKKND